jgi:ferredoxin
MIRITHYREKCIGCFYCVELAPQRWQIDENDGKCNLLDSKSKKGIFIAIAPDFEYDENLEAQNSCPVNCIKVERVK